MQPLARDGLIAEQVTALLHGDFEVSAGLELLSRDLRTLEDITDDLIGGGVAWDKETHGTATLAITRRLAWGNVLVRPYMILTSDDASARFNLGVYCLTTPLSRYGEDPQTFEVQGYDRLYLLQRQVGASYTVNQGLTYRVAILQAFTAAGLTVVQIDGVAADSVVPKTRVWPLVGDDQANPDQTDTPATWLRIVNDLLRAIAFDPVWVDENGVFRCQAHVDPTSRAPEFHFDADDVLTIIGEDRSVEEDAYAVPSRWVFRWSNAPEGTAVGDLTYQRDLPADDPMSAVNRGLVWTQVIDFEAASRTVFVALGDARVAADRRRQVKFDLTTGPFPAAGHADVFTYRDDAGLFKVRALSWDLPLDGSDMRWNWEAVT